MNVVTERVDIAMVICHYSTWVIMDISICGFANLEGNSMIYMYSKAVYPFSMLNFNLRSNITLKCFVLHFYYCGHNFSSSVCIAPPPSHMVSRPKLYPYGTKWQVCAYKVTCPKLVIIFLDDNPSSTKWLHILANVKVESLVGLDIHNYMDDIYKARPLCVLSPMLHPTTVARRMRNRLQSISSSFHKRFHWDVIRGDN